MEKRIGTVLIEVESKEDVQLMNDIISRHSQIIIGRQGLPRNDRLSIISLVLEGTTDEIGSLTGQLGRLNGIQVKSALLKNNKENETENGII
jgi:putative iron-only hydrogenase system regulator